MRKIIHIDMDAFFASIEQRDRPELRGKPVIVGGAVRRRGVVSTCSYEARKYGVHSAMPSATALRLCPQAVFIEPDFRRYVAVSETIREIFRTVTDLVEPMSIDEAYLDVTGNRFHEPSATRIAEYLRSEIRARTHLTASAGVSYNKFLAKVGSDFRKPDGLTVITPETAREFLDALPVGRFPGIGEVTAAKLEKLNIHTGRELRLLDAKLLEQLFGKAGAFYYKIVRGIDERPVELPGDPKSISREITFPEDCSDPRRIRIILRALGRKVFRRALAHDFSGRCVTVKVKYADFRTVTRSATFPAPPPDGETLGAIAVALARKTEAGRRPVRLLGVGVSDPGGSAVEGGVQLEFPFVSALAAPFMPE